jgi:sialidase-1
MPAPFLEKTVLFTARTNGYYNYRVPGIATSPSGVILATGEARRGTGGDWDANDVVLRRSFDNGQTWDAERKIVDYSTHGDGLISNFVFIPDRDTGEVHALYCHSYSRAFYIKTSDNGTTFSEPREITSTFEAFKPEYDVRKVATGPGHGIQLENGRLVVPVWMSDAGGDAHRPSVVSVIYSDDHGATWERGDIVVRTDERFLNPSETVVAQLSDGRVMLNIRNESDPRRRLVATSADGATGWTDPAYDEALLEPQCMGSLLRLYRSNRQPNPLLFANPDNLERTLPGVWNRAYDRKLVTVKASLDEGQTWAYSRVVEEGPSGYSDMTEAPDGNILLIYECGMLTKMADTQFLTVARFNFDWVASAD